MTDTDKPTGSAIYKALAEFQALVSPVKKETQAYKYKYADLPSIIREIQPHLTKCKLAVSQTMDPKGFENGETALETIICHYPTGDRIRSCIPFKVSDNPQDTGKLITYYRRYTLGAILNIVTEEDDDAAGHTAVTRTEQRAVKPHDPGKAQSEDPVKEGPKSNPKCPVCDLHLRKSKKAEEGWYCWKKQGGCGWTGTDPAAKRETRGEQAARTLDQAMDEGCAPHYHAKIDLVQEEYEREKELDGFDPTVFMDRLTDISNDLKTDAGFHGLDDKAKGDIRVHWGQAHKPIAEDLNKIALEAHGLGG